MKSISLAMWLCLTFFVFVGGAAYMVWLPMRGGELYEKERYAYLQKVEFEYRNKVTQFDGHPILLSRSNDRPHTVLGLPSSRDKTKYVWITLDDVGDAINSVTVVPQNENFALSCRYLAEIKSKFRLALNTANFLQSHCSSGI